MKNCLNVCDGPVICLFHLYMSVILFSRSKSDRDLQKHIRLMHNERYEYQCNECEFKTKDINHIKRHMLKFHLVFNL